ncbi:MAG: hypothetical protein IH624_07370 [Phycisphaerae bacterium]|nr:hypothetical protein [Phycisphaerae bacterium]
MKPFLTWLTLGAIFFLCSCEENRYQAQAYQPNRITPHMQHLLNDVTPAISYSSEIDTLNKPDFSLSFEDDLQAFHTKVHACAERKARRRHRLRGAELCRTLIALGTATPESAIALTEPVLRTEQAY